MECIAFAMQDGGAGRARGMRRRRELATLTSFCLAAELPYGTVLSFVHCTYAGAAPKSRGRCVARCRTGFESCSCAFAFLAARPHLLDPFLGDGACVARFVLSAGGLSVAVSRVMAPSALRISKATVLKLPVGAARIRRSPGATTKEVSMCDGAHQLFSAQKAIYPLLQIKPPLLVCVEAVRVLEQPLGPLVQR